MKATVSWEQKAVEQLLELAVNDSRSARRLAIGIRTHAGGGGGDVRKLEGNATEWRLRVVIGG